MEEIIIQSKILSKKPSIHINILNLYNKNKYNQIRKNSIAQRYRKKNLSNLVNDNFEINNNQIDSFCNILDINRIDVLDYLNYDFKEFNSLKQLNKIIPNPKKSDPTKLSREIIDCYTNIINDKFILIIHGSHANGETTPYSDIDSSIFIKNNEINSVEDLFEIFEQIKIINNKISFHDSLSHHSTFLNLYSDTHKYPEIFMPIDVLEKGITSSNKKIEIFFTREDLDLKLDSFFKILNTIIEITNSNKVTNLYYLKELISSYFMILILEYEILFEKYTDKKTIFQKELYNYKSKSSIKLFQQASLIREFWPISDNYNMGISDSFIISLLKECFEISESIQTVTTLEKVEDIFLI